MLLPLSHHLIHRPSFDSGVMYEILSTMLDERRITWRDLAEAHSFTWPGYICLLLFDGSKASQAFRECVQQRYEDLDRITGDDLLILTVIPPPPYWIGKHADRLRRLPTWAAELHHRELVLLSTREGAAAASAHMAELIRTHFNHHVELPSLCVLCFEADPEGAESAVEAVVHDMSTFTTEARLLSAFQQLATVARESRMSGLTAAQMASRVASIFDPGSLRWRRAINKLTSMKDLIEKLFGMTKQ